MQDYRMNFKEKMNKQMNYKVKSVQFFKNLKKANKSINFEFHSFNN